MTAIFLVLGTALGYQGRHMRFTEEGAPILSDPGYTWFLKVKNTQIKPFEYNVFLQNEDALRRPTEPNFCDRSHEDFCVALLPPHLPRCAVQYRYLDSDSTGLHMDNRVLLRKSVGMHTNQQSFHQRAGNGRGLAVH